MPVLSLKKAIFSPPRCVELYTNILLYRAAQSCEREIAKGNATDAESALQTSLLGMLPDTSFRASRAWSDGWSSVPQDSTSLLELTHVDHPPEEVEELRRQHRVAEMDSFLGARARALWEEYGRSMEERSEDGGVSGREEYGRSMEERSEDGGVSGTAAGDGVSVLGLSFLETGDGDDLMSEEEGGAYAWGNGNGAPWDEAPEKQDRSRSEQENGEHATEKTVKHDSSGGPAPHQEGEDKPAQEGEAQASFLEMDASSTGDWDKNSWEDELPLSISYFELLGRDARHLPSHREFQSLVELGIAQPPPGAQLYAPPPGTGKGKGGKGGPPGKGKKGGFPMNPAMMGKGKKGKGKYPPGGKGKYGGKGGYPPGKGYPPGSMYVCRPDKHVKCCGNGTRRRQGGVGVWGAGAVSYVKTSGEELRWRRDVVGGRCQRVPLSRTVLARPSGPHSRRARAKEQGLPQTSRYRRPGSRLGWQATWPVSSASTATFTTSP